MKESQYNWVVFHSPQKNIPLKTNRLGSLTDTVTFQGADLKIRRFFSSMGLNSRHGF